MFQRTMIRTWICSSCWILLSIAALSVGAEPAGTLPSFPPDQESGEPDTEDWGSGFSSFQLHTSFAGDGPFVTKSPAYSINCTQRFWLPPPSPVCWEKAAEPEEFAKSRSLALQNRAALEAVSTSSGVEEEGISYNHQAREEVQGIQSEHQNVRETVKTIENAFVSLAEKRIAEKERVIFSRMQLHLAKTRDGILDRTTAAVNLERQFSALEKTLLSMQLQLNKFLQH